MPSNFFRKLHSLIHIQKSEKLDIKVQNYALVQYLVQNCQFKYGRVQRNSEHHPCNINVFIFWMEEEGREGV